MQSLYAENEGKKTSEFRANVKLNALILELKELLSPAQESLNNSLKPQWPVGCIIGNARSGSTLLLQFLASTGVFSYPTNVLTRFAYAPYVGGLVQKMLFDAEYDFHGDFTDIQSKVNFKSSLGKSKGALATSEFQHFFRNYMPNFDAEYQDEETLEKVDVNKMRVGLASIEQVFQKPFVTKGFMLQYNVPFYSEHLPFLFYMYIRRAPLMLMQSMLIARKKYYGDSSLWFSIKPKEYEQLKGLDIYHQIAGQVYFTEKAIEKGLECVPESNQIVIEYESLCAVPKLVFSQIIEKYSSLGFLTKQKYRGPTSFECSNKTCLSHEDINRLQSAYDTFSSGGLKLHNEDGLI